MATRDRLARLRVGACRGRAARGLGGVRGMKNDYRARNHPAWWAFAVHRVSGLALAAFLPFHFWALGQALGGEAALQGFLVWAERPLVTASEWGLGVVRAALLRGGL